MGFNYSTLLQPENIILLGNATAQRARAETYVSEAKNHYPDKFDGKKDFFYFDLRYVAPFDKGFGELKRLQGTAAEAAGRRDEFRGYIIINLSSYLTHENDDFFAMTLRFLIDMSDCWKYVFLVDNKNQKAARELVGKTLAILLRDIPCDVEEVKDNAPSQSRLDAICKGQNIACSSPVKVLLQELLGDERFGDDIITALLRDVSSHCGKKISTSRFADFFATKESVIKYMLPPKEYERLMDIIECRKKMWYGEKEAV